MGSGKFKPRLLACSGHRIYPRRYAQDSESGSGDADLHTGAAPAREALAHARQHLKVDRTTLFGNPFSIREHGHDRAVALHRAWLTGRFIGKQISKELLQRRKAMLEALPGLHGKNLACWCPLPVRGKPAVRIGQSVALTHVRGDYAKLVFARGWLTYIDRGSYRGQTGEVTAKQE